MAASKLTGLQAWPLFEQQARSNCFDSEFFPSPALLHQIMATCNGAVALWQKEGRAGCR